MFVFSGSTGSSKITGIETVYSQIVKPLQVKNGSFGTLQTRRFAFHDSMHMLKTISNQLFDPLSDVRSFALILHIVSCAVEPGMVWEFFIYVGETHWVSPTYMENYSGSPH